MLADSIKLRRVVRDLGDDDPALAGIFSPGYSFEELNRHIHALFQDNYQDYMRPFPLTRGAIDHWKGLIADAMPASHADYQRRLCILDIGSGEGTSVFPLIELFPNADIVASDLSLNLLRELGQWQRQHYADRPLPLLQLNAQDTVFEDAQLDLVTGAHVLHHLGDLRGTFVEIHRILKPGGIALFWEPFESGCQMVSLIMQLLIARNETTSEDNRLSRDVVAGFREYMSDLHRRKGSSKSQTLLDTTDDKWIFTRTQLEALAEGTGLELKAIRQVASPDGLIVKSVDHELARRSHSLDTLPGWARDLVEEIEEQFSPDYLSELLFSGVIVLTKPSPARSLRPDAVPVVERYVYQPVAVSLSFAGAMQVLTERGYSTVKGPVHMTGSQTVNRIRQIARDNGIEFADHVIDPEGFRQYVTEAGYLTRYPEYYRGNLVEKTLEHFISLGLLQVAPGDVFIDIASEHSPFAEIVARLKGATTFSQDIMYQEGIVGNRIGGDACAMPVSDGFASKACLTCSLEHFEGNADARLFSNSRASYAPAALSASSPSTSTRKRPRRPTRSSAWPWTYRSMPACPFTALRAGGTVTAASTVRSPSRAGSLSPFATSSGSISSACPTPPSSIRRSMRGLRSSLHGWLREHSRRFRCGSSEQGDERRTGPRLDGGHVTDDAGDERFDVPPRLRPAERRPSAVPCQRNLGDGPVVLEPREALDEVGLALVHHEPSGASISPADFPHERRITRDDGASVRERVHHGQSEAFVEGREHHDLGGRIKRLHAGFIRGSAFELGDARSAPGSPVADRNQSLPGERAGDQVDGRSHEFVVVRVADDQPVRIGRHRRVHVSPVVGRIEREVDNARAHRGRQCESCLEPLSRELRDEQHAVGMGCHVSPGRLEPDRCRVDRIPSDGVQHKEHVDGRQRVQVERLGEVTRAATDGRPRQSDQTEAR